MKANWLASLLMSVVLGVSAGQQTNAPGPLPGAQTFNEILAKATNGDPWAEFSVGVHYLPGTDGGANYVEALKWLTKSGLQGNEQAQAMLGDFYQYGWGGVVDKDNSKACYWYLRSAKQGNNESQIDIGWMYYNGQGVMQDYVEAYKWFNIACTSTNRPFTKAELKRFGDDESLKGLLTSTADNAKDARDNVAQSMTPEQIALAQQRSAEFVPVIEDSISSSENLTSPDNPRASGTGFFITDDGYLISNYHVVRDADKVRLLTGNGLLDVSVVKVDVANDLALLKATGKFVPLPIAASRTVQLGSTVATVGFPDIGLQGFAPKLAKGEIASLAGAADDPRYFQISLPVQPGNSGGALVDIYGNVVGIVGAKLDTAAALAASGSLPENVNYAVKSSLLLSFLESAPDVETKLKEPLSAQRKFEDVVRSAQDAAVLVLVY